MHKFLKMAATLAGSHEYEDCIDYHLCAIIVRGGNVISVGFNKRNTNGFVEHYTDKVRGNGRNYCLSTHAEHDAILQVRSKIDLTGCKIFIVRVKAPGSKQRLGMAAPCAICRAVLAAYSIKRAYYTIDDDNYGVMNISENINNKRVTRRRR